MTNTEHEIFIIDGAKLSVKDYFGIGKSFLSLSLSYNDEFWIRETPFHLTLSLPKKIKKEFFLSEGHLFCKLKELDEKFNLNFEEIGMYVSIEEAIKGIKKDEIW